MQHLVRDPIHFTIPLSSDERRVVDHPLFQRLRHIKQTAFLLQVFPGATHDRFSHSLGVMHMAGLMFDSISAEFIDSYGQKALPPSQQDYLRRLVRVAALLHDVGHGPFSHSLEGVSHAGHRIHPKRADLLQYSAIPTHWISPKLMKPGNPWLEEVTSHEDFSIAIIAKMADEHGLLAGLHAQDIAATLCDWVVHTEDFKAMSHVGPSGRWNIKPVLKALVSGELDCDRMDYLLRDSHYTGVPYGKYDREMLIDNLSWRPDPRHPSMLCLCLKRKALHAFEDFLISRYHMFLQVYSHKTVVGFDVILENALAELTDFRIDPDLEEYCSWSDDWLLRKILANRSSRWGAQLRDRQPLKHLFTIREEDKKAFEKFIGPYEKSSGTTMWFPTLKNSMTEGAKAYSNGKAKADVPKLWWRQCTSFLTKGPRGRFPIYLEERRNLVDLETVSLLLKSDYVRRVDIMHVYCLRDEEKKVIPWLTKTGVPESILAKPQSLVE